MATDLATSRELDAFRDQRDRFIADLLEESYLHFAGHKETFELEAIYARYEELSRLETVQRLKEAPTELRRFACESFLGNLTRRHQEELATAEAALEATVDGQTIPYRMMRVEISNEPDRDRRERIERERVRLLDEQLNPLYLEAAQIDRAAISQLGAPNAYELYQGFGYRLDELAAECRELLDETERLWEREATGSSARGSASASTTRARRMCRASGARRSSTSCTRPTAWCRRSTRRSPTSASTCARRRTSNSISSAARKVAARVLRADRGPGPVMLVIQPIGGKDDWEALFHEAGHAEHFGNTSADLPWRRSGSATRRSRKAGRC